MSKTLKQKLESISFDKQNLYSHLTQVLRRMLIDSPANAYDLFEQYSLQIRNKGKISDNTQKLIRQSYQQLHEYIEKTHSLINKPNVGTSEQPAEPGPTGFVPNLLQQSKWYENLGVGFGEQLTYKIFKSLERFSITKQIKQLRFWGKIITQHKDYFVAQGLADGGQQAGELPPDVEPKGQGVNKLNYWVCTDLNGQWIELPLITPQQLRVSRKIKYFFTGDLQAVVVRNPHFVGRQKHLLKCQLVRITASCTIVPRTMYNVNADDKKQIDTVEQWKWPTFEALTKLQNWVHHPINILKNGRLSHLKPELIEGQDIDEEKLMKEIQAKDPFEERLKPLTKDAYLKVPAWKISTHGDICNYRSNGKINNQVNYGFISIRSNIWKGFTFVYHNKGWSSLYVGYGFKTSDKIYFPYEPESILNESPDLQEQSEPNFPPEQPKKQEPVKEVSQQQPDA